MINCFEEGLAYIILIQIVTQSSKTLKLARHHSNVRKLVMKMFYASFGPSTRQVTNASSRPRELTQRDGLPACLGPKTVEQGLERYQKCDHF